MNARRQIGFTLIELLIALGLFAILSSIMFGSLRLAGRSTDAGEEKAQATAGMRLASDYLRTQLTSQHPQRMRKMLEFPLLFVGLGGMWYYRLSVAQVAGKQGTALVLDRMIPDLDATSLQSFNESDRSVLADDIKAIKISYFGRDRAASLDNAPTWRGSWDDSQLLPILVQIEVTPARGEPWPPIVVAPRASPEAGCRAWDTVRGQCVGA
jgi:general secretion pathway protein J